MLILTPSDFSLAPADDPTVQLDWVRSDDGQRAGEHGRCAASLLPADAEVVLVLPVRALSWHRLALPKVAASRLRAVLDGLLEERLLGDTADLHFALEPGARPGQTLWVAACDKAWLRSWLQTLEAAGHPVARIVPALWPTTSGDADQGETVHWAHDEGDRVWLATATPLGIRCVPMRDSGSSTFGDSSFGDLGPATATATDDLLLDSNPATTRYFADPAITALAEQVCNQRFDLMPPPLWLLRCARSDWNIAQFDLSLSSGARRGQHVRQVLREWRQSPAWRPARWGLAAVLLANLVGLNAAAWNEHRSLQTKRLAVRQTLQQTFPQVTLVLDAPVQMQRELARLQQAGGQLSPQDLEAMLSAVGQGSGVPTAQRITFSPGSLRLEAAEPDLRAVQALLPGEPWRVQLDGQALQLQATAP